MNEQMLLALSTLRLYPQGIYMLFISLRGKINNKMLIIYMTVKLNSSLKLVSIYLGK